MTSEDFWIKTFDGFVSEADVESRFVRPLLSSLGYPIEDIVSQHPVLFQQGRGKRPGQRPSADFVVFAGKPHSRATCLLVVETKKPNEPLIEAGKQAESYAQALSAPLYILTDGLSLEIWQREIADESHRVFECRIGELASLRGVIEGIVARDAIIDHCKTLRLKSFAVLAADLSAYCDSEMVRCRNAICGAISPVIERGEDKTNVSVSDFLLQSGHGARILAPSGFGKTTFAKTLMIEALEGRMEVAASPLPIEVFLPDLTSASGGFETYLRDRLKAHIPAYSLDRLRDEARLNGLLVVADGFDRLPADARRPMTSELRNLLRDYPKSRVIILSRPNSVPEIALPQWRLQGFDDKAFDLLINRDRQHPQAALLPLRLPLHLKDLCRVPLIAVLVAEHHREHNRFPTRISMLYEEWLDRILDPFPVLERGLYRAFLERLADETIGSPIDVDQCLQLAKSWDRPAAALSDLATADAISIRGSQVELVHEGLADFLRAKRLLTKPLPELVEALQILDLDSSSQLPALLLSAAPSRSVRGAVWKTLATQSLELALSSLKFTISDGHVAEVDSSAANAEAILTDLADGIDLILEDNVSAPFSTLAYMAIAGKPVRRLGLEGSLQKGFLNYSAFAASATGPRVRIRNASSSSRSYGISLEAFGYDAGAGFVLAATRVHEAIGELIRLRLFRGGRVWTEEMVFSRLRHLSRRYRISIAPPYDLQACRAAILHLRGRRLKHPTASRPQLININELIVDIDQLLTWGCGTLEEWWTNPARINIKDDRDRASLAITLDRFYRRYQQAYQEVVENNLEGFATCLQDYGCLPLSYDLEATIVTGEYGERLMLDYQQWPVRSFAEAGAAVTFPDKSSFDFSPERSALYEQRTDEQLAAVGRSWDRYHMSSGSGSAPKFDGRSYKHDDLEDETAVVSAVMKSLTDDCKGLFSGIPRVRRR